MRNKAIGVQSCAVAVAVCSCICVETDKPQLISQRNPTSPILGRLYPRGKGISSIRELLRMITSTYLR